MPVPNLAKMEQNARRYRITFAGELSRSEWPERHRKLLEAVQELSNKTFDSYSHGQDTSDEPWKAEVRALASQLREHAHRCSHRNESSWRFACEPIILGRISSEVCCQICRKRLWRSEIEVAQDDNSRAAAKLKQRQEAREPCRCPRIARSQDMLEATGLNSIFNYRADEQVHHDKEISEILDGQKPDRVYGLRQTRNIENLLYDSAKQHFLQETSGEATKQVHELIELHQPLTQTGDRLLFPFLVLEAKSESAPDSWHSIQMQTAFPIRTLLDTQDRLRKATGPFTKWRSGPLVWFLSNKGEDWRVSVCYTEAVAPKRTTIGHIEYRIIDVWRGSIITRDGALQLLLLVDYIFDWARDKYRNDIIAELRVLASGDNDTASTIYVDSDVYSTFQFASQNYLDEQHSENEGAETTVSLQKEFNYDTPAGVVRHATFVESRFYAILVTKDNVQMLLRSTAPNQVGRLCFSITNLMNRRGLAVEAPVIDDIEWIWTGTRHAGWTYRHQNQPLYYALISFCTYLDAKWHIVRELSVIAVASDAWTDIVQAADVPESPSIRQIVASETLVTAVRRLQAGSPNQILLSAIMRRCIYLKVVEESNNVTTEEDFAYIRYCFHFIYVSVKKGTLEPQESFMRISRRLDQQTRLNNGDEPLFPANVVASEDGCVLVTGTCLPFDENRLRRNFCAYLTMGDAQKLSKQDICLTMRRAYETRDVYHTTRNHGFPARPVWPGRRERVWNLQGTYGVHSHSFGFLNLLRKLGGTAPTAQASSRACGHENGSRQYIRNLAPWQDYRGRSTRDREQRRFVLYKIFSQEIAYWRSVAKNRRAEGVNCCNCCAAIGSMDICRACQTVLDDPNRYTWLKKCLKGEDPFPQTEPTAEDMKSRLANFHGLHRPASRCFKGAIDGWDDEKWAQFLDFYPRLNEPFSDIQQLATQWKDYEIYCQERKFYGRKRRRSSSESDSSESDDSLSF